MSDKQTEASTTSRYPPTSNLFLAASSLAFFSAVLILIAFCAPYWLESWEETRMSFVRLGLWDVCFNRYRHPPYQYDEIFHGCHWVHSYTYQNIRDWLLPGWFLFVQAMMTFSFIFTFGALIVIALLLMRYLLRFEMMLLSVAFVLQSLTTLTTFIGVMVFAGMAFDRRWLQYPNYNHLSWAWCFALIAILSQGITSYFLFKETFNARERQRLANNLLYNMQPRGISKAVGGDENLAFELSSTALNDSEPGVSTLSKDVGDAGPVEIAPSRLYVFPNDGTSV